MKSNFFVSVVVLTAFFFFSSCTRRGAEGIYGQDVPRGVISEGADKVWGNGYLTSLPSIPDPGQDTWKKTYNAISGQYDYTVKPERWGANTLGGFKESGAGFVTVPLQTRRGIENTRVWATYMGSFDGYAFMRLYQPGTQIPYPQAARFPVEVYATMIDGVQYYQWR